MAIVTLTSDFGLKDHFVASLKGALLSAIPNLNMVDISHSITPFDLQQAAFTLGHAWKQFPAGTIHLVCVGPSPTTRFRHIAFRLKGHYFIGSDNGIFSLFSEEQPELIIEISKAGDEPSSFTALDVYVPFAAAIASGLALETLGEKISGVAQLIRPRHLPEEDVLKGNIVYIDSFGNLVTDITKSEFERIGKGRDFSIVLIGDEINSIVQRYSDVDEGDKLALFNSEGLLEIAINQGKANQLLNLRVNTVIRVTFTS
jgi:S-adenosyl-L-methionine hydrolase (adenosine-forming)